MLILTLLAVLIGPAPHGKVIDITINGLGHSGQDKGVISFDTKQDNIQDTVETFVHKLNTLCVLRAGR